MSTQSVAQAAQFSGQSGRIGIGGTMVRMGLLAAVAVLFNFYPEKVGILWSATDWSTFTPVLAPEFQAYLFWLNLWWGLAFSLEVAHLLLRQWISATRWLDLALQVFGVFLLGAIVRGNPFSVDAVVSATIRGALVLVIARMVITAVQQFDQLLGGRRLVVELRVR